MTTNFCADRQSTSCQQRIDRLTITTSYTTVPKRTELNCGLGNITSLYHMSLDHTYILSAPAITSPVVTFM